MGAENPVYFAAKSNILFLKRHFFPVCPERREPTELEGENMKEQRESDQLLSKVKKIHMVGIGGSGMCPLAEILLKKGYLLTGSDNNESDTLARIRSMGISVTMGHFPGNVAVSYTHLKKNFKKSGV